MEEQKQLEYITSVDFLEHTEHNYAEYGKYVNTFRAIPSVFDGLKPVQRRVIFTAIQNPQHQKTAQLATSVLSHHPHGDASIFPVCEFMKRNGIFDGQGQFGCTMMNGEVIEASAPRYTSCWISQKYQKMFSKFLPYCPTYKGEYGLDQPHFIPTPVPMTLVFGGFGIGIGTRYTAPQFSMSSLLKAYLADDPTLLEPAFEGITIPNKEELKAIWKWSEGSITYKWEVEKSELDGLPSLDIVGTTELLGYNNEKLLPAYTPKIRQWINEGRVFVTDATDVMKKQGRLKFAIAPRVKSPTWKEFEHEVEIMSTRKGSYNLEVNYAGVAYYITMYDWIDITYHTYIDIYNKYQADQIARLEHMIPIYKWLKPVAELMYQKMSTPDIAKKLNIEQWIVTEIGKKSLSTLQKYDTDAKLKSIDNEIKRIKSMTAEKYIKDNFIDGVEVEEKTFNPDEETD